MFVKQVNSDQSRNAVRLDSIISISVHATNPGLSLRFVDGSTGSLNYVTNAESRAAFDELLELLGWVDKPKGETT